MRNVGKTVNNKDRKKRCNLHSWYSDDKNIDWKGIGDAAEYIGTSLLKYGRMGVRDYKEKYGTIRVYVDFGWHQLHSVTHPRHVYSQYPKWLWKLDCQYISRVVALFNWIVIPYHMWLYTYIYGRALKKWPHLRSEILQGADHNSLLEKYGVHTVRTDKCVYSIYYDWHPDCYYVRHPSKKPEDDSEDIEVSAGPIRWIKREGQWPHV